MTRLARWALATQALAALLCRPAGATLPSAPLRLPIPAIRRPSAPSVKILPTVVFPSKNWRDQVPSDWPAIELPGPRMPFVRTPVAIVDSRDERGLSIWAAAQRQLGGAQPLSRERLNGAFDDDDDGAATPVVAPRPIHPRRDGARVTIPEHDLLEELGLPL